ncbi:MAG TPA: hypothetical protein VGH87_16515 [Polyangiaceae bacterium]
MGLLPVRLEGPRTVVGLDLIGKIARAGSKTKLERVEIFRSATPPTA